VTPADAAVLPSTAIVLAGGRSTRMGRPKALLPFGDRPLILHVVETLSPLFTDVVVVAAPSQVLPELPATVVRDEVAFQGPVAGIGRGLAAAGMDVSFVISCDSVFLDPRLIRHLVDRVEDHDAAVPHWHGRFQPLHAVYRRTVLPHLEARLARGELRLTAVLDTVKTRRIDEAEIRAFDPEGLSFFNVNTPDDYAWALTRWAETGPHR
jgi:molybdopterin-guanine dinucleotide biosynthesis protein A